MASLNGLATHSIQSGRSVGQLRIRPLLWPPDISIHHHTVCILLLLSQGTDCFVWHFVYRKQEGKGACPHRVGDMMIYIVYDGIYLSNIRDFAIRVVVSVRVALVQMLICTLHVTQCQISTPHWADAMYVIVRVLNIFPTVTVFLFASLLHRLLSFINCDCDKRWKGFCKMRVTEDY